MYGVEYINRIDPNNFRVETISIQKIDLGKLDQLVIEALPSLIELIIMVLLPLILVNLI